MNRRDIIFNKPTAEDIFERITPFVEDEQLERETQADSLSVISIRSGPVDRLMSMVSQSC